MKIGEENKRKEKWTEISRDKLKNQVVRG